MRTPSAFADPDRVIARGMALGQVLTSLVYGRLLPAGVPFAVARQRAQPTLDALVAVARPAAFCLCPGWSCTACQCRLSLVMAYEEFLWGSTRT